MSPGVGNGVRQAPHWHQTAVSVVVVELPGGRQQVVVSPQRCPACQQVGCTGAGWTASDRPDSVALGPK
jgi:hypothetical protein